MQTLTLDDGRLLDYDTGPGDQGLPTLVFHHGTPQAGTRDRGLDRAAAAVGLRVVTFSRAGYGGSTRRPGRTVGDVAGDVRQLLDHLGVERCVTAGASGGGPHTLATAALLPDRVAGVCSIAGVGPWGADDLDFLAGMGQDNVDEFGLALEGEDAVRPWMESHVDDLRSADPEAIIASLASLLPEVDRAHVRGDAGSELGEDLAAGFAEALRTGVDGWVDDDLAFTRPWGFELDDVRCPALVYQGSLDLMVPAAHGAWLAGHLPTAEPHLMDGEGHLSIQVGRSEEMLTALLATLDGGRSDGV